MGALIASLATTRGDAQVRRSLPAASSTARGVELELHGTASVVAGRDLLLRGVTYGVTDLATLRPLPHAHVSASLVIHRENDDERVEAASTAESDVAGRFAIAVPVPLVDARSAEVRIDVSAGGASRRFVQRVMITEPYAIEVMSDRVLYEPGETIHAWVRVTDVVSRAPVPGRRLRLEAVSQGDTAEIVATREFTTSNMGAASFDVPIDRDSSDRGLTLRVASVDEGIPLRGADLAVRVGRRAMERMNVTVRFEHPVVAPGEIVRGAAVVRAASGAPIAGAQVELRHGSSTTTVTTNAAGQATFAWNAPVFAARDVQWESAAVRAVHPAAGSARATASYVISSAPFQVSTTMGHDGAIPEIDSPLYLAVTDPLGAAVPRGTRVRVSGRIIGARAVEASTDAHGFAVVPVRASLDAIATHRGGECDGVVASTLRVEVIGRESFETRACVPVSRDAMVRVEARPAVVVPGGVLHLHVTRRSAVRTRSVAVDLLGGSGHASMVLGSVVLPPGVERADVPVPRGYVGILATRARPVSGAETAEGTGSLDAVLVRPAHAFDLHLDAGHRRFRPGDTARFTAQSPPGLRDAAIAFVVRDLAAHAGERNFARAWLGGAFSAAVVSPDTEDNERLVRVALASVLDRDFAPTLPDPLVPPIGESAAEYSEPDESSRGDLRDPFARRDEFVRRGVGPAMRALEAAIESDLADGTDVVIARDGGRAHFAVNAIASLVSLDRLPRESAVTLGDAPLTVALLERAQLGFDFDRAARRVARARLVRLLAALLGPVDPGEETPSPLAPDPPDRWLSRLVTWGRLSNAALRDPWGGTFVLHPVQGRRPAVSLGARVIDWELASPGPDGVLGNADDVRDPFERVVPEATAYAVASGEDDLMQNLASLDPGADALQQMLAAYRRIGAGAHEETIGDVVTARDSEGAVFGGVGEGTIGTMGYGSGRGSGMGYGRLGGRGTAGPTGALAGLASLVRERFPATLLFVGEHPLHPSGRTTFDVPLADALTTYRIEAIAWTADGWTTSARTQIEVDRDVVVDAPIPSVATPGDVLRVPVRVANRSDRALRVRVGLALEEGLDARTGESVVVALDRGESREVTTTLDVRARSMGRVRITAIDEASGAVLDAVRRPMAIVAEARPAVLEDVALVDRRGAMRLEVPADAVARTDGVVRITAGTAVVADPSTWGARESDPSWAMWALAMSGRAIPSALERGGIDHGADFARTARVAGAHWTRRDIDDATIGAMLARLSAAFDTHARSATEAVDAGGILLGLLPAIAHREERRALREALDSVVRRLQRAVDAAAAPRVDGPALAIGAWLLRASSTHQSARADEYLRRAMRAVHEHGEGLVLEGAGGSVSERVRASSTLALAVLASGDRATAFCFAREIGDRDTMRATRDPAARALAYALFARLTTQPAAGAASTATIRVDGIATTVPLAQGEAHLTSAVLSRPGVHTVAVELATPAILRTSATARFGLPWSRVERIRAPLEIVLDGAAGARDTRSAFWLRIRNRGPRVLQHAIARIELPAGAEVDDEARRDLVARLGAQPIVEGRTLTLPLRPLAPGGSARLPLRIRWTLGGTLHGLGVAVRTDDGAAGATATLAPRVLAIPDRGEEPLLEGRRR
jgi:hypothetical protein